MYGQILHFKSGCRICTVCAGTLRAVNCTLITCVASVIGYSVLAETEIKKLLKLLSIKCAKTDKTVLTGEWFVKTIQHFVFSFNTISTGRETLLTHGDV